MNSYDTLQDMKKKYSNQVLWDHRPSGGTLLIHPFQMKNAQVLVKNQIINIACQGHLYDTEYPMLRGTIFIDNTCESISISMIYISKQMESILAIGDCEIPITVNKQSSKQASTPTIQEHTNDIQDIYESFSKNEPLDIAHLMKFRVNCYIDGSMCQVYVSMATLATIFRLVPISKANVLVNGLSKSLEKGAGASKTGFVGLSQEDNLTLLMDNDPSALVMPLVGIWVANIHSVNHPLVWTALCRFVYGSFLVSKICSPPQPVLLVVYPLSQDSCSFPQFYDCFLSHGNDRPQFEHHVGSNSINLPKITVNGTRMFTVSLQKSDNAITLSAPASIHPK